MSVGRVGVLALLLALAACARLADPLPGYARASDEDRAALMRAVSDYYTVRARAFVSGDAAVLFAAYPKLAQGSDMREGINVDALRVPSMHELSLMDIRDELEGYEPARVYVKQREAVVFVHGLEIWNYTRGGYTGLEFFTRIDLVNDADRWLVERTDEQMMAEPPPRIPLR